MRTHNGMRPHDVVVLMKIISMNKDKLAITNKDLAKSLMISPAEITHSLNRSAFAGLFEPNQKRVNKQALLEFLMHGIKYVFPTQPNKIIRGIPTAHSAKPLSDMITSSDNYVWASLKGNIKGESIAPLYDKVPEIVENDAFLYQMLALVDAIRVGRNREYLLANQELEKMFSE